VIERRVDLTARRRLARQRIGSGECQQHPPGDGFTDRVVVGKQLSDRRLPEAVDPLD
jgi:hypothetical protein